MATWAEQPFQLIRETGISSRSDKSLTSHPAYQFARVMALTHNAILRALNALYNQCLYIKPGTADAIDFLFYCQCFVEVLQGHHKLEDDFLFVELKRISGDPTSMDQNLQEHQDFEVDLDKFRQYVFETHADAFDGEKVKTLLDGFGKALEKHLHREIPTLIDLHVYDQSALQKVFQEFADRGRNEGDKYRHVPLFLGCTDRTFVLDGQVSPFPPLPFFAPYIFKFVFERRHAGSWRFNPSDTRGNPRPMAIGPK